MRWTSKQERVLRDHAPQGAAAVSLAIYEECGTARSVNAVRVHAARMGVSLAERFTCPQCGHEGGPRDFRFRDGLCEACHIRLKAHEIDERNAVLEREYEQAVKAAYRENAMMRQRTKRIRRKMARLSEES